MRSRHWAGPDPPNSAVPRLGLRLWAGHASDRRVRGLPGIPHWRVLGCGYPLPHPPRAIARRRGIGKGELASLVRPIHDVGVSGWRFAFACPDRRFLWSRYGRAGPGVVESPRHRGNQRVWEREREREREREMEGERRAPTGWWSGPKEQGVVLPEHREGANWLVIGDAYSDV